MADHQCECSQCGERYQGKQLGSNHFAVRFGHAAGERGQVVVLVNGEQHQNDTYEALTGKDGWAYVYCRPTHRCQRCGDLACSEVIRGEVIVKINGRETAAV